MPDKSMHDISELLKTLHFRKKFFFGVDERDVWQKLDEIEKAFREDYNARETRCRRILESHGIDWDTVNSVEYPDTKPEDVIVDRRIRLRDNAMMWELVRKVVVLLLVAVIVFGVVFGITSMKGNDMEPRISAGDLLLYFRLEGDYSRNDLVVMKRDGKQYVGRLIGTPGDSISISETGTINIDGNNLMENGIFYDTKPYPDAGRYPRTLDADQYFLLADKRDTAKDSRYFGPVEKNEIKGKVITCIRKMDI